MTKAQVTKFVGSLIGLVLAGASAKYPQLAPLFVPASTLIFGWLHLPQPGAGAGL